MRFTAKQLVIHTYELTIFLTIALVRKREYHILGAIGSIIKDTNGITSRPTEFTILAKICTSNLTRINRCR